MLGYYERSFSLLKKIRWFLDVEYGLLYMQVSFGYYMPMGGLLIFNPHYQSLLLSIACWFYIHFHWFFFPLFNWYSCHKSHFEKHLLKSSSSSLENQTCDRPTSNLPVDSKYWSLGLRYRFFSWEMTSSPYWVSLGRILQTRLWQYLSVWFH